MSSSDNLGPIVSGNSYLNTVLLPCQNHFKVAHLNCRSISPSANSIKLNELKSILSDNLFDAFALSETWLHDEISNRAVEIPGYKLCRNDRPSSRRGGGVGIYISKKLKYKFIFKVLVTGCESLFVELNFGNVKLLLGVVYLPKGDLATFERHHRDLFLRYSNIIVIGDFNCNLFDTIKANLFRSLCIRCNLSIVHNVKPTHFDLGRRSTSLIDFVLVSNVSMVSYSGQVQCPSVSDHALIFAALDLTIERLPEFVEYRDFRNIDWDGLLLFLNELDTSLFFSAIDVDMKCSFICSLFNSLFSYVPVVKKMVRYENDSWMESRDVVLARSLRDLSFSAFQSDRSSDNWNTYCRLRNKAKSVIRRERRKHFTKLFSGLDSAGLWRVLKGSGCVGNDDVVLDDDVEAINAFFVSGGADDHEDVDFDNFYDSDDCFSFRCVSEIELLEALNKVKSRSVGIDNISIHFIKLVFPFISGLILHLINYILTTSVFPVAWKTARVVPIPKSRVVHGSEDLRPISILPALSKVVEHLLRNQILESTSITIYESQYAFRQGFNTTSLLLELTDSIRRNINDDRLSVLVSLDLSKAFNSINYARLIMKLRNECKFSKSACRLILSYLSGRSQFVVLNGVESDTLSLHSGVPQGSVLGPLLFILYINDLPLFTNSRACKTFLFADDVFLLFNGNRVFSDILENSINSCLDRVLQWTTVNSLAINSSKTKAIMFGPTNRFFLDLNIFLGEEEIEFVSHHRCLGVVLDCKLSFKSHIDALVGKVWGSLRKIYCTHIFLPFHVKRRLAQALLMSQVLYGLEVVSCTIGTNFTRLKRIVNNIVRFVYNVRRWDHISDYVQRFLGCSFEDFVKYRSLILFHKVIKSGKPLALCEQFVFSRSTRNPHVFIPRIVRGMFERSYVVRVARCWNRLPYELRIFSHTSNVFRLKLLRHFS